MSPESDAEPEELAEADYAPVASGPVYRLTVSEQGQRVDIEPGGLVAGRRTSTPEHISFALVKGTFAGGRLVVWPGTSTLEAELSIFGSGIPIVRSERGELTTLTADQAR